MILRNYLIGLLCLYFLPSVVAAGGGVNLFGTLDSIHVDDGTISIFVIIAAVLATEHLFEYLHYATHDTPFQDMVSAIEKELMIVGSMAFIFKIVVNIAKIGHNWVIALEYSDLFIPLVSFCFCIQGLFLILISIRQCALWSKAFHLTLDEVLFEYYGMDESKLNSLEEVESRSIMRWFASLKTQSELEFKVFHELFCDQFKILSNEFPFDLYVERVYEKVLLDIITIRPLDWFIIVLLTLLNFARVKLKLNYGHTCKHGNDDHVAEHISHCEDDHAIKLFCLFGAAVFCVSFILAAVSRVYERSLLSGRGVESLGDCIVFLRYAETQPKESVVHKRLSSEDLKSALEKIKIRQMQAKDRQRNLRIKLRKKKSIIPAWARNAPGETAIIPTLERLDENSIGPSGGGGGGGGVKASDSIVGGSITGWVANSAVRALNSAPSLFYTSRSTPGGLTRAFSVFAGASSSVGTGINNLDGVSRKPAGNIKHKKFTTGWESTSAGKQIGEDVVKIFWFNSPNLYFAAVMVQIMIVSCYLSLWLTNYCAVASRMPNNQEMWIIVSILPGVLCVALGFYIVRCAALLKAVSSLDKDIVEEIIEQAEASKNLSISLRNKIIDRLQNIDNPEEELKLLFDEIDEDGSKMLTRAEFQVFLHDLNITFSRKRWNQIFKEIDRNFDDRISIEEMFLFIFPDNNASRNAEIQRLKRIRRKVMQHTTMKDGIAKTIRPALLSVASNNSSYVDSSRIESGRSLYNADNEPRFDTVHSSIEVGSNDQVAQIVRGKVSPTHNPRATAVVDQSINSGKKVLKSGVDKIRTRQDRTGGLDESDLESATGSRSMKSLRDNNFREVHITQSAVDMTDGSFDSAYIYGLQPRAGTLDIDESVEIGGGSWILASPKLFYDDRPASRQSHRDDVIEF